MENHPMHAEREGVAIDDTKRPSTQLKTLGFRDRREAQGQRQRYPRAIE